MDAIDLMFSDLGGNRLVLAALFGVKHLDRSYVSGRIGASARSIPVICLDIALKSFDVLAETRRRWTAEERLQIVAESEMAPVSVVARRHGVAVSLVFRWRRQAGVSGKWAIVKKSGAVFVLVMLAAPEAPPEIPKVQAPD